MYCVSLSLDRPGSLAVLGQEPVRQSGRARFDKLTSWAADALVCPFLKSLTSDTLYQYQSNPSLWSTSRGRPPLGAGFVRLYRQGSPTACGGVCTIVQIVSFVNVPFHVVPHPWTDGPPGQPARNRGITLSERARYHSPQLYWNSSPSASAHLRRTLTSTLVGNRLLFPRTCQIRFSNGSSSIVRHFFLFDSVTRSIVHIDLARDAQDSM